MKVFTEVVNSSHIHSQKGASNKTRNKVIVYYVFCIHTDTLYTHQLHTSFLDVKLTSNSLSKQG